MTILDQNQMAIETALLNHISAENKSIIAHVDISNLKVFLGTKKNKRACENLRLALDRVTDKKSVILIPAFTYAFCKTGVFNLKESISEVGIFSNFMLAQNNICRSNHPVFSFVATGQNADEYCARVSESAFGENSIFDRVKINKGKIIFIGASFQSCTFVHHIESLHGVSYRYDKEFAGTIVCGDIRRPCRAVNSVRYLDRNVITNLQKFEDDLVKADILRKEKTPIGIVMSAQADTLFEFGRQKLSESPDYFLQLSPKKV